MARAKELTITVARAVLLLAALTHTGGAQAPAIAGSVIPAAVVLHEIGLDYALGVHTDEDGVKSVVEYRVTRR